MYPKCYLAYTTQKLFTLRVRVASTMYRLPLDFELKLIRLVTVYLGFSIEPIVNCKILTLLRRIYVLAIFMAMTSATILSTRFWITTFSITSEKLIKALFTSTYFLGTYCFGSFIHWEFKENMKKHKNLITEITNQSGVIYYKTRFYVLTCVLAFTLIAICIALEVQFVLLMTSSFFKSDTSDKEKYLFFDKIATYSMIIIYFYMIFSVTLCLICFSIVCLADKLEFKYLNEKLSNELKLDVKMMTNYFDQHSKLTKALDQSNDVFSFFVLIVLCAAVPFIILVIYATWTILTEQESLWLFPTVFPMIYYILLLTILPAAVNCEVSNRMEVLFVTCPENQLILYCFMGC